MLDGENAERNCIEAFIELTALVWYGLFDVERGFAHTVEILKTVIRN